MQRITSFRVLSRRLSDIAYRLLLGLDSTSAVHSIGASHLLARYNAGAFVPSGNIHPIATTSNICSYFKVARGIRHSITVLSALHHTSSGSIKAVFSLAYGTASPGVKPPR